MTTSTEKALESINFPGGVPSSSDLAPSLVFLVLYILSIPVVVFRLCRRQDRTFLLLRPVLFILCRLIMLIIRAIMSKHGYNQDELIAELVLTSIGYLFLIEPCIQMWKKSITLAVRMDSAPQHIQIMSLILQFGLYAAIAAAIGSSALISGALNDSSKMTTVTDLRKASVLLALIVNVILIFAIFVSHHRFGLAASRTLFLFFVALSLAVVSFYKTVQTFTSNPNAGVNQKVVFWVCQMTFEFLAFAAIIGISIPKWFPEPSKDDEQSGPHKQTHFQGGPQGYQPSFPPQNGYFPQGPYQNNNPVYPQSNGYPPVQPPQVGKY